MKTMRRYSELIGSGRRALDEIWIKLIFLNVEEFNFRYVTNEIQRFDLSIFLLIAFSRRYVGITGSPVLIA